MTTSTTSSDQSDSASPATDSKSRLRIPGRYFAVAPTYIWLLLFFLVPFLLALKISFAEPVFQQPPYTPIFDWTTGWIPDFKGSLANYRFLTTDSLYIFAYLNSLKIAVISTLLCLLLGYPMAYGIARAPGTLRNVLLMAIILPFWTSFLIRIYAWIGILKSEGVLNNVLLFLGLIDEPLALIHNWFSLYVGIVYTYLPFMILPLYANLAKMDESLLEAASDLGCRPWKTFVSITLPLSFPGIIAGSMLVFIPTVGEYVIPALLGGPDTLMIGPVLWNEFFQNVDWPVASTVAIAMLVLLVIPIAIFQHYQSREDA